MMATSKQASLSSRSQEVCTAMTACPSARRTRRSDFRTAGSSSTIRSEDMTVLITESLYKRRANWKGRLISSNWQRRTLPARVYGACCVDRVAA